MRIPIDTRAALLFGALAATCFGSLASCSSCEGISQESKGAAKADPKAERKPVAPSSGQPAGKEEEDTTDEEMTGWTRAGRSQWLLGERLSSQRTLDLGEIIGDAKRLGGQVVKLVGPGRLCGGHLLLGDASKGFLFATLERPAAERAQRKRIVGTILVEGKLVLDAKRVGSMAESCEAGRAAHGVVEATSVLIRLGR